MNAGRLPKSSRLVFAERLNLRLSYQCLSSLTNRLSFMGLGCPWLAKATSVSSRIPAVQRASLQLLSNLTKFIRNHFSVGRNDT